MTTQKTNTLSPWLILAFICLPVFIGSLDLTVVSAFLPEVILQLELPLQTGLDDAAWIVSGYLLAYTIGLTFMGRVSDLFGRRKVYIACLLVFMVGSMLVAEVDPEARQGVARLFYNLLFRLSGERPDPGGVALLTIIVGRVIQALGAGALVPVSLALVGDLFPPAKRARPLGLIGAIDTLGWVLGHLYGGIFVQVVDDWRWLFWVNVPLTLLALLAVIWSLRGVPQNIAPGRFDFLGTGLIVGALICLTVGLGANVEVSASTSMQQLSPLPPYAAPVLLLGVGFLLAFVLVEARLRDPIINLRLFLRRNISAGALTNLFVGYSIFIGLVIVPILLNARAQDMEDLRAVALAVGLLLSTLTIPMALAAVPGGWLTERIGMQKTTLIGLVTAGIGFVLVWRTWTIDVSELVVGLQMIVIGTGLGLTFSPISAAVINAAREHERGVASALVIVLRLIGGTISISTLTALALWRVNVLAEQQGITSVLDISTIDAYGQITGQVLAELGLIGAVMCALALIPAALLRDGQPLAVDQPEAAKKPPPNGG
ncbi:MAG: MFS transporter [Chloroflexi bacterium]|nr:MFS transporter [Chloroflexota bacterium]